MSIKSKLQIAMAAHQAGQLQEAEQLYQAILLEEPTCLDALNLLGILYDQQQKYTLATDVLLRVIQQDPSSHVAHCHLATCLLHLGDTTEAIKHLDQAVNINPDYAEAYNILGNVYQQINQIAEAKNYYKKAINLRGNYIDALINLGTICLKINDFNKAKYYFEQVIKITPEHAAANFQLGNIAYQHQQFDEAIVYYEKIPTHANAQLNFGSVLLEKGHTEQAITKFKTVLALNPKHLLAHSNLAAIYVTQQQFELAIPHYYEILSQDTENYTAHFNLGAIYMKQRKWETAAYHLSVAIRVKNDDPDAHDNYATTLLKLNRDDLARKHYLQALQLRPNDEIAAYRLAALTGTAQPDTAPAVYIQSLFDNYAENFDHELMDALQYKVPEAIYKHACLYLHDRWDLNIIDLGCGTGLCGRYFIPRSRLLVGVDLSDNMLTIAKQKHIYDKLINDDMAASLNYWHEQIDLITAADSFVYVGDLTNIFTKCYQALASTGYLIFTTEAGYEKNFQLMRSGRYTHHADYIKQLAGQIGFEVEEFVLLKLREEKGQPVNGWLVVLKKTSP